ncbi:GntR family transcriptional regulator, partial [Rhizobium johnstonii]
IVSGILSAKIRPVTLLSENQLATLFCLSRTRFREAMMRLETRGIVHFSPRRGWFVVEPSAEEAIAVYQMCGYLAYKTGMQSSCQNSAFRILK